MFNNQFKQPTTNVANVHSGCTFEPVFGDVSETSFRLKSSAGTEIVISSPLTPKIRYLYLQWLTQGANSSQGNFNCFDLVVRLAINNDAYTEKKEFNIVGMPDCGHYASLETLEATVGTVFQISGKWTVGNLGEELDGVVHAGIILGKIGKDIIILEKQGPDALLFTTLAETISYYSSELINNEYSLNVCSLEEVKVAIQRFYPQVAGVFRS